MSSLYIRQLFESWMKDPAMNTPYYETVNKNQNPSDLMWVTAEFDHLYRETMTFCAGKTEESGEIELVFFGPAGEGYTNLLTAIEADMITLMAQRDPAQRLVLMSRSAPFESSGGDAAQDYNLSIFIDYVYYE